MNTTAINPPRVVKPETSTASSLTQLVFETRAMAAAEVATAGGRSETALFSNGPYDVTVSSANTGHEIDELLSSSEKNAAISRALDAENFVEKLISLIGGYGDVGVEQVLRTLNTPALDEKRWEFFEALGSVGHSEATTSAERILAKALRSTVHGDRAAAASGLGDLGTAAATELLLNQIDKETNRVVRSVIAAKLRARGIHVQAPSIDS